MHGGEPLLAGPSRLRHIARELRGALDGVAELDLRIHTNGVLLSERFCEIFEAEHIKVGISLDGDRVSNDRHRLYSNGRSSYDQVIRAVTLLRDHHPDLYAGLLCTIDIRNDPIAVYEGLTALDPPRIDFLLPHATWDQPPLRPTGGDTGRDAPYADWLIAVHDRWVADGRPVAIRMFDSIVLTGRGRPSQTESLGLSPTDLVVIETDGSYEQADSLKTAFDGAPATGLDVFRNSLDEAALHPGIAARHGGTEPLAPQCRTCPLVVSCGGGLYAHRYKTGSGFVNPSVYCRDLFTLIPHVQRASGPATHALPTSALDSVARASAGPSEIAALAAPQRSRTVRLLATARRAIGDESSWALLSRLEHDHPGAVRDVLGHPYVRAWATGRLGAGRGSERSHLASIAAAAAIRAGRPSTVTVPVTEGMVDLPTLGRMHVGQAGSARVEITGETFRIHAAGQWYERDGEHWDAVRSFDLGGVRLAFDDVDPYRDCYDRPALDRLSASEAGGWEKVVSLAWEFLREEHPKDALAVQAGLRVMTPLAGEGGHGSSTRQAYGAAGVSASADPVTLAAVLVRESRKAQLGAVLDMYDLLGGDAGLENRLCDAYGALATAHLLGPYEAGPLLDRARATLRDLAGHPLPQLGRHFLDEMTAAATAECER
ncbi:hypothetical protein Pth03_30030 [Planotetraspora thailandica]|uniref:FxsB family radical SAM/SPASM domain protein n=2 Tax=Planotetraspora thailandica TaxID=487172 RepID=A0A8J3V5X9_9ACTN|nr:hypothetical protein Pth03_30030 [Planotetraspora thailandica]